jgi:hypothetical protein
MPKYNYVVGIYDDRETIKNKNLGDKYKDLTEFFIRHMKYGIGREYLSDTSINAVLNKALEKKYDYCVIMSVGHFINNPIFFDYIESWMNKIDFFVTGHIIDRETNNSQKDSMGHYWGLHKQCMIVNLKYYEEFGKPHWGDKFKSEETIELVKAKRSKNDIHDDYTPLFLLPTKETKVCTPYVDGWNFINKSLENGLSVFNFHPKIRTTKGYSYPNKNIDELKDQLLWINSILSHATNCVFLWNTETYKDIKDNEGPKIKKLYSVAAAFKPNFFLNKFGFYEDTEIVYYDYSKQALAFKKLLLDLWDGRDYPKFINKMTNKYQINVTAGGRTENKSHNDLWIQELEEWGGEENLYNHWQKYKKLKHTFIHCDILTNPDKLINYVDQEPNSYIWWSNAFHTVTAHYTKNIDELKNHYNNNWVSALENKNPNLICFGTDYMNNRTRNLNIKDCYFRGE